jgi:hypothetical protein
MNICNVLSDIRDLKVNAIYMEPNGNDSDNDNDTNVTEFTCFFYVKYRFQPDLAKNIILVIIYHRHKRLNLNIQCYLASITAASQNLTWHLFQISPLTCSVQWFYYLSKLFKNLNQNFSHCIIWTSL